jgi:hypothetical protein
LQFADWLTNKICGFAICGSMKRNLGICDGGLSPRICGFKKTVAWPPLKIYSEVWGKQIHEKIENLVALSL